MEQFHFQQKAMKERGKGGWLIFKEQKNIKSFKCSKAKVIFKF